MRRSIVLIGGGGHCVSSIEVIESSGEWKIAGVIDALERKGESVLGYPIIGSDEDLPALVNLYESAIITVGQTKTSAIRKRLFIEATQAGFNLPTIAASTSKISIHSKIGAGTVIFHFSLVNARAVIAENCIINSGAIIEHDAIVGAHTHVSTGAIVNGGCKVGTDCFIGSGAVLKNGICLANGIVLGAGAIAINDLMDKGTYVGCPARKVA